MKNFVRQHWGVLFLSLVAVSVVGAQFFSSLHPKETVTEIFFADRMTEAHRIIIDEFNALHRGQVKVVPIDFPNVDFTTNERKEVLARSLRGEGDDVDIFAVDPIWVERFARWSEPLDQYFDKTELNTLTEETLLSCYKDGQLVAIPFDQVRGVLLYNDSLLRSLPHGNTIAEKVKKGITWEEFVRYGERVPDPACWYVFPAAEYEGLICVFTEILLGRQRDYFRTYGFDFQTRQADQALQFLVDLVQKYRVSPQAVTSMTEVSSYEYFVQHKAVFLRAWTTYDKDFTLTPEQKIHLKMAPLPHFKDGSEASTMGGWNLMVSKFSPKKKEAVSFVKFLLSKESQEIIYSKAGYFPVIKPLFEDSVYQTKYPELITMYKTLTGNVHRPSHEKYTKYSEILAHAVSQAIRGTVGVNDALRQATRAIESEKITLDHGTVQRH
jgi:multiple sugar transport system substrate-binding protein